MNRIRIIDLDNCISDDEHRIHLVDCKLKDPYRKYHAKLGIDEVKNKAVFTRTYSQIIIFTARPQSYLKVTIDWLKKHGVNYRLMLMRPPGSKCDAVQLKTMMVTYTLKHFGLISSDIEIAIDDRDDVVKAYATLGINSELVAINDRGGYYGKH